LGEVAKQRTRRGLRNGLWLACLALFCAATAVVAQTAIEVRELLEWGDNEMALERAEKGLEKNPQDAELKFYHALALARTGETDDAIDAFKALAEQYPDRPEVHNNLAVLYAQDGQYEQARASLEAALNTDEVYSTAHKNLADIYSAQAAAAYNRALARGEQRDVPKPELSLLNDWSADAPVTTVAKPDTVKQAPAKRQVAEKSKPEKSSPSAPKAEPAKPEQDAKLAKAEAKTDSKVKTQALPEAPKVTEKTAPATKPEPETPRRPTTLSDVISAAEAAGAKVVYPDKKASEEKDAEELKLISTEAEAANQEQEKAGQETEKQTAPAEETKTAKTESPAPVVAPQQAQRAAQAVENWAAAWRKQDVEGYLAAYADFFRPEDGLKHDAWAAQRRDRLASPKFIRLTLQNLRIRLKGEGRAIANFQQDYQSDTYQDSVAKVLYLERIKGEWRIVREVSQ